jgi:hypothetical protein
VRSLVHADERLQLAPASDVPDPYRPIGAKRGESAAGGVELRRQYGAVCSQRVQDLACLGAPQACGAVFGPGRDDVALRAVRDGEYLTGVALKGREPLSGGGIAEARHVTFDIGRDEARAVGREVRHVPVPLRPADARDCRQHARGGGERVVQGLLGLAQHGAVVPARRLRRLDRQQDAQLGVDVEVRLRRGGELPGLLEPGLVARMAAQDEGERRQQ